MNRWPFREALEHYFLIARERARAAYTQASILYALQAPYAKKGSKLEPPERPGILGS